MLRNKNLIPLSHQHQHALALCVRIDRAQPIPPTDLPAWQAEIEQIVEQEIKIHFAAEETVLFPAAQQFPELVSLVEDLLADHASLRQVFSKIKQPKVSGEGLLEFAQLLSMHIRKEERQLFESIQQRMTSEELTVLGAKLDNALKDATHFCALTNDATRPKRGK